MNSSTNFDGNDAIGNGEVDSSILSGSTILLKSLSQARAADCWDW
jgi:hypothetical protein